MTHRGRVSRLAAAVVAGAFLLSLVLAPLAAATPTTSGGAEAASSGTSLVVPAVDNNTSTTTLSSTADSPTNTTSDTTTNTSLTEDTTDTTTSSTTNTTTELNETNTTETAIAESTNTTSDVTTATRDLLTTTIETVDLVTEATAGPTETLTDGTDSLGDAVPATDGTTGVTTDGTVSVVGVIGDSYSSETTSEPVDADRVTNEADAERPRRDSSGGDASRRNVSATSGSDPSAVQPAAPNVGRQFPGRPSTLAAASVLASAALAATGTLGGVLDSRGLGAPVRHAGFAARERLLVAGDRIPLVPFGYSRYDDSDPLAHDGRKRIYDLVVREPGVSLSIIGDDVDASLSTVRHHLHVLQHERLVETRKQDGRRRYYPIGTDNEELQAAMRDPTRGALLRTLAERDGAANGELADELGRDPSTVTHHLQRLEDAGLVVREKRERSVQNSLAGDVDDALRAPASDALASDD